MEAHIHEWLNLVVRWFHVIAGITWIGQTYLFNWMENRLAEAGESGGKGDSLGPLWMVHGGGFYLVEKQKKPAIMPTTLHWFKWEAAFTWISGMLLLFIVYYWGGLQLDSESNLSESMGIGIGLGVLVFGWLAYDLFWSSPLGKNEVLGGILCYLAVVALAYGLTRILSPRAAYIHVAALFGTIMVANVWMRILPGQRKMIKVTEAGGTPDPKLAARAKQCSKHNTLMSVPLIFMMISNHFPTATYGHNNQWMILSFLILVGAAVAQWIRSR